jgi:hypothetical protein
MGKHSFKLLWFFANILFLCGICAAESYPFVAYSMREAEFRAKLSGSQDKELKELGGITRLAAAVYDAEKNDLIIVGQVVPNEQNQNLDDLVVAFRSLFVHKKWPEVSIEKSSATAATNMQTVRYEGRIDNTHFGKCFFDADVVLKKISLGLLPTEIWGCKSYFDLAVEDRIRHHQENVMSTRFWFNPIKRYSVAVREGVVALNDLRIRVDAQLEYSSGSGSPAGDSALRNDVADKFAQSLTGSYNELSAAYTEVAGLKPLMDMIAIASGVQNFSDKPDINYWLYKYHVPQVQTQCDYSLLKRQTKLPDSNESFVFEVEGGVKAEAAMSRLVEEGDVTAIKELVCISRPKEKSLVWRVPLEGWCIPGYQQTEYNAVLGERSKVTSVDKKVGCTINEKLFTPSSLTNKPFMSVTASKTVNNTAIPTEFGFVDCVKPLRYSSNVGGVMLDNVAKVQGDQSGPLDMAGAKFSFVVDGDNAQLDPQTFRKFVTALWAVYYSNEDPGISIDPIAPGAKKHMVRYIGQVINTDLGRVMRESDYLMKKWAVGTEKAEIDGFKSPLDYAADAGSLSVGTWSRFWFVPKDMQFRRSENMLLFEGGKMTVQTEYMFRGFGSGSDPSNQKFSEFFTEHYQDIAKKYPIYKELYEYAKMVSLAKYLKDSGVPLFWFLMANKDMVITEDSVSTVDALVKNSKQFEGVQVEGGVDLHSEGQYIYDTEALSAVNNALAKLPSRPTGTTSLGGAVPNKTISDPFSFTLKERSFSVLPQHSSSSGKDYRGMRYQTDFSLKEAGFQLTDKSVAELKQAVFRFKYAELLYAAAKDDPSGKVETIIEESWQKAHAVSEEITGNLKEILHKDFKSKASLQDELAKCMPQEELTKWKDLITQYASYNTNLELVRWFSSGRAQNGAFGPGWDLLVPYQIKAVGKDVIEFEGMALPKKITLVDKLSGHEEVLTFDKDRFTAIAYVPYDIKSSRVVGLFVMTDGSYRLLDKIENEFAFNSAGYLTDMIFSDTHKINFAYQKDFEVKLDTAPYKIEKADSNWIEYREIKLPEKLLVKNLANGKSETLVFSKDGVVVGYIPESLKESQFKLLALMTNLSYRLVDKKDNEIVFNQSGEFEKLISTSDEYLIKSMSSGNYAVDFGYKINDAGKPVISQAELTKDGKSDNKITMQYFYDADGRLDKAAVKEKQDIKAKAKYATNLSSSQPERVPVLDEN